MSTQISVVIPCYNQGSYIKVAIDSVTRQTYDNYEIIIINDGSTDDSAALLNQIAASHSGRITVLHQENRGLSMARQVGLERAKGEWVVFLDSDDWLMPIMFEACLNAFSRHPEVSGVVGSTKIVYSNGTSGSTSLVWGLESSMSTSRSTSTIKGYPSNQNGRNTSPSRLLKPGANVTWPSVLQENPFGACCSVMLRKSDVIAVGGTGIPGVRACEDWDLYVRMIRNGMKFAAIPEVVSCYLQHENTISKNFILMLHEKIKMLERLEQNKCKYSPTQALTEESYGTFQNGYVFYALGQVVGCHSELKTIKAVLSKLYPSHMAFRYSSNQFLFGLQQVVAGATVKFDREYIEKILDTVFLYFLLYGLGPYSYMFIGEIRREMKSPMKKYSILRRVSRLLDPTRKYWLSAPGPSFPPTPY